MDDTPVYNWPVLLDPPNAVPVAGSNSYRLPSGVIVARTILTTVAHVGTYGAETKWGGRGALYSDGTVRSPDLTVLEDIRKGGGIVTIGRDASGKPITTNDTPRNPDGTPFQWNRAAALSAAGVQPAVADQYAKGGVDILTTPIPTNSAPPITFGPYKGLFPDANGGRTLLDSAGVVRVPSFDYAAYFKLYSPVQYDASGMEITAANGNTAAYRSYAPADTVVSNMVAAAVTDDGTFGTSPTIEASETGGMPKIIPAPSPNLASGGRDLTDAPVQTMAPAAVAPTDYTKDKTMWVGLAIVILAAFGLSRKGR